MHPCRGSSAIYQRQMASFPADRSRLPIPLSFKPCAPLAFFAEVAVEVIVTSVSKVMLRVLRRWNVRRRFVVEVFRVVCLVPAYADLKPHQVSSVVVGRTTLSTTTGRHRRQRLIFAHHTFLSIAFAFLLMSLTRAGSRRGSGIPTYTR